ncbi:ABC transporter transmembrane domain-containing protein [Aurantimonas sp. 22II-16-19i]|uniref:ABC transporter transmembrane domain-containing protein n=1 Tax=Aurantimonas sp. 22II-16-19i TaxID=1317114 RepID=UPI0009F7F0FF|nr:ABC transporter transmembrane domain-containing protein [Aurantimonas sp. 22II-16-19i]ORE90709.1 multidrug ABC transporter ATPase and permease-like protein [Aurantimonas sp. 22II-16-19i]
MTAMGIEDDGQPAAGDGNRRTGCGGTIPPTLWGLVRRCGFAEQLWLVVLSIVVFVLSLAPLELQRRIVNGATDGDSLVQILQLAGLYAATAITLGLLKLAMNVYRGRVSENAVRWLRAAILRAVGHSGSHHARPIAAGVEVSLVLNEVEPIGSFVGVSLSEPLLKGGILVSTFAYLAYLEPMMALVALAILSPQFVFVPIMQKAINERVGRRIATLRMLSAEIVDEPRDVDAAEAIYDRQINGVFALNMGVFKLKYSMNFLMNLMHHLGVASVLALGGYYVVIGTTEVGTILAFISGLSQINAPWGDVVDWYRELKVTQTKYAMITLVLSVVNDPLPPEPPPPSAIVASG